MKVFQILPFPGAHLPWFSVLAWHERQRVLAVTVFIFLLAKLVYTMVNFHMVVRELSLVLLKNTSLKLHLKFHGYYTGVYVCVL